MFQLQYDFVSNAELVYRNNRNRHLELVAQTAQSLSSGDIVEKTIRSKNAWSLLPAQVSALSSGSPHCTLNTYCSEI
jgi:hypothetical protein